MYCQRKHAKKYTNWGDEEKIVRDNVILELGLFPDSSEKIHLPTDLIGITMLKYNAKRVVYDVVDSYESLMQKIMK